MHSAHTIDDGAPRAMAAAAGAAGLRGPVRRGPRREFGRMVVQMERRGELQEFNAYVYPRIRFRFRSSLVNQRNLQLGGDDAWEATVDRVLRRRKPVGFVSSDNPADMVEAVGRAIAAGCPVQWSEGFCSAGVPGQVGRQLDLDALIADYRELTSEAGVIVGAQIAAELRRIAPRAFADCLSFTDVESDLTPAGWARCGLLLGYPVESTAAIIGAVLRMEGCWKGSFGRFCHPPGDRTRALVQRFLAGDGRPAEPWLEPYADL
jgi:hypothetical protein